MSNKKNNTKRKLSGHRSYNLNSLDAFLSFFKCGRQLVTFEEFRYHFKYKDLNHARRMYEFAYISEIIDFVKDDGDSSYSYDYYFIAKVNPDKASEDQISDSCKKLFAELCVEYFDDMDTKAYKQVAQKVYELAEKRSETMRYVYFPSKRPKDLEKS